MADSLRDLIIKELEKNNFIDGFNEILLITSLSVNELVFTLDNRPIPVTQAIWESLSNLIGEEMTAVQNSTTSYLSIMDSALPSVGMSFNNKIADILAVAQNKISSDIDYNWYWDFHYVNTSTDCGIKYKYINLFCGGSDETLAVEKAVRGRSINDLFITYTDVSYGKQDNTIGNLEYTFQKKLSESLPYFSFQDWTQGYEPRFSETYSDYITPFSNFGEIMMKDNFFYPLSVFKDYSPNDDLWGVTLIDINFTPVDYWSDIYYWVSDPGYLGSNWFGTVYHNLREIIYRHVYLNPKIKILNSVRL